MSYSQRALFVAFEGIDNGGKTTLIQDVKAALESRFPVTISRELTTDVGRLLLTRLKRGSASSFEKTLLFAADRQRRLDEGFADALSRPGICLADRWTASAIAYRCAEDPALEGYVRAVNAVFPKADLTLLIDISETTSVERGARAGKNNYGAALLEKVRKQYGRIARADAFMVIPGERPYADVRRDVLAKIERALVTSDDDT